MSRSTGRGDQQRLEFGILECTLKAVPLGKEEEREGTGRQHELSQDIFVFAVYHAVYRRLMFASRQHLVGLFLLSSLLFMFLLVVEVVLSSSLFLLISLS